MQSRIFCQFPFSQAPLRNVPNSDKVISYMKSQGFPNQVDTVMIVLLLIFLFLVDLQVDSVSQSMYTIVHHFMRISSEIFNFQKIYFQESQS